jgi:hypothetical protein
MIGTLHFLEKVLTIAWKLAKVGHEILWNTMEKIAGCTPHPLHMSSYMKMLSDARKSLIY